MGGAKWSLDTQDIRHSAHMANHNLHLSFFGKINFGRLERLEAQWLNEKQKPKPWDRSIAHRLRAARAEYRDRFEKKHGVRLGFMSFFIKACIVALKELPAVNAEIEGDDLVYKNYYHIGVAVGTPQGLVVPVVRDADGLALSSRNTYLNPDQRRAAPVVYLALCAAQKLWQAGVHDGELLRKEVRGVLEQEPLVEAIDYVSVADAETMEELDLVRGRAMVSVAVKIGRPRLIDNIILE